MARRLKLTRSELQEVEYLYLGAFRLRVDVTDPTGSGADPNIFLYNLRPTNPYDGTQTAEFLTIAAPADMAQYPVGLPNAETTYPFFRLPYVELDFPAAEQAEATWLDLVREAGVLVTSLDRMERLVQTQEVWVGAPPESGNSASASTSSSTSGSSSA